MSSIGAMIGDVFKSLFTKPATEQYPFVRKDNPTRLRGKLHYNPEKCIGCSLCARDCPAMAIELITIDKASKRYVIKYYYDRCTFCNQCVESCRFGCLELSNTDWELASLYKQPMVLEYGREEDLQTLLERNTQAAASEAETSKTA